MTKRGGRRERGSRRAGDEVEIRLRENAGEFIMMLFEGGGCSLNDFGEGEVVSG